MTDDNLKTRLERSIIAHCRAEDLAGEYHLRIVEQAARIEALEAALYKIRRVCEMSAGIMRDVKRTGGWEGAEKTARAFDRLADDARTLLKP